MIVPARTHPDRIVTSIEDRREAVLDVIRQAKRRLVLSLFRCNDLQVFEEVRSAVARGVAVDVLMTSRAKGGKKKLKKLWDALQRTGAAIHAYTDPVVKYHAKYIVADEGPALVTSLNLTRKCFNKTTDALVLTYDPQVVTGLRQLMDADRLGRPMPEDLTMRLIVGPERARSQFTALIDAAESSIRLLDAKLSDPDLLERLNARRARGLRVEVFGGKRVGQLKSHGKIMLVDDRLAVVGGLALAALSLDFRREIAIIVEEPSAVADVDELFRTIQTAAPLGPRPASGDVTGRAYVD